ncbi:MAG: sulfate adenylyltransferase [Phycisphaerales bacterium]
MSHLIEPHGGTLVNRFVSDPRKLLDAARTMTKLPVSNGDLSTVYRIADGTLSPLTGPMNEDAWNRVLAEQVVAPGSGKTLAWTIPLAFPITTELAQRIKPGQTVAITNAKGDIVATLDVQSVYAWDKPAYLRSVYRTDRTDHPGADIVLKNPDNADKTHLVGGGLHVIPLAEHPEFGAHIQSPDRIRKMLEAKGYDAAVAFQTRNPLHRAHEYALVYGLETLLRQGRNAVAVLNPLLGETKGDDVSAAIRMKTYERLINSREMGDGDSDAALWKKVGGSVPDRVLLLGLDIKMFYGGPSEAIMHAIYRQNMGFTHIIIGRKHADAPFAEGTPIWGDFDAQEIFGQLHGELHIQPVKVGFAAYYESAGRVDLMDNHKDEKPVFISGKQVRATLQAGEQVDPRIMRPSTSAILAEAMKQ